MKSLQKIVLLTIILGLITACQKQNIALEDKSANPKQKRLNKIEQIKQEINSADQVKNDSLAIEVYKHYSANNSVEEGVEFLEKFYDKNSKNDSILFLVAQENYKLKKLDEALNYLKKLKSSPRYKASADNFIFSIISKKEKADQAYQNGLAKFEAKDYDNASLLFQSGLRIQADHQQCSFYKYFAQALSYYEKGDQAALKNACELLTAAVKIMPDNGLPYYYLALANCHKTSKNNKSITDYFEMALKNKLSHEQRIKVSEEYETFKNSLKNPPEKP